LSFTHKNTPISAFSCPISGNRFLYSLPVFFFFSSPVFALILSWWRVLSPGVLGKPPASTSRKFHLKDDLSFQRFSAPCSYNIQHIYILYQATEQEEWGQTTSGAGNLQEQPRSHRQQIEPTIISPSIYGNIVITFQQPRPPGSSRCNCPPNDRSSFCVGRANFCLKPAPCSPSSLPATRAVRPRTLTPAASALSRLPWTVLYPPRSGRPPSESCPHPRPAHRFGRPPPRHERRAHASPLEARDRASNTTAPHPSTAG